MRDEGNRREKRGDSQDFFAKMKSRRQLFRRMKAVFESASSLSEGGAYSEKGDERAA